MTVQVSEMELAVGTPTASSIQVAEMSLAVTGVPPTVTGVVLVNGVASTNARGGDTVRMNLTIDQPYTSVSWVIQDVSAPVDLAGTDISQKFVAPYLLDGADALIAVTVTGPGGTSDPLMLAATIYPHADWYLDRALQWQPHPLTSTV